MRYNEYSSLPSYQYQQIRQFGNSNFRNYGHGHHNRGGFLLPFLTGVALTAPFWGGGFGGGFGGGVYPQPYPQPYPVPYPYPTPTPTPPPYYNYNRPPYYNNRPPYIY